MKMLLACALLVACGDDDVTITDSGVDSATFDTGGANPDVGLDTGVDAMVGDTWENFAQGWLATYCTECHSGGTRDYTTPTEVMRDLDRIRCGVSPDRPLEGCGSSPRARQFPIGTGAHPDDDQRRRFVAWLDAGMP